MIVSTFPRAARFTLGAAYALRAIPYGKGYNSGRASFGLGRWEMRRSVPYPLPG